MVSKNTWRYAGMVLMFTTAASLGNITYISQSRSVTASATVWPAVSDTQGQNDTHQSNDPGTFDKTANALVSVQEQIPGYAGALVPNSVTSYANASQQSSFDQTGISENGSLDYYTSESELGNGAASAASNLSIKFQIDQPYSYELYFIGGIPGQIATLTDLTTNQTLDFSAVGGGDGMLLPGEYELDHSLSYGQAYHASSMPINFGLNMTFGSFAAVPEPGVAVGLVGFGLSCAGLRRHRAHV